MFCSLGGLLITKEDLVTEEEWNLHIIGQLIDQLNLYRSLNGEDIDPKDQAVLIFEPEPPIPDPPPSQYAKISS